MGLARYGVPEISHRYQALLRIEQGPKTEIWQGIEILRTLVLVVSALQQDMFDRFKFPTRAFPALCVVVDFIKVCSKRPKSCSQLHGHAESVTGACFHKMRERIGLLSGKKCATYLTVLLLKAPSHSVTISSRMVLRSSLFFFLKRSALLSLGFFHGGRLRQYLNFSSPMVISIHSTILPKPAPIVVRFWRLSPSGFAGFSFPFSRSTAYFHTSCCRNSKGGMPASFYRVITGVRAPIILALHSFQVHNYWRCCLYCSR
ncbi:hypothetical protein TRVA0_015S02608 [Trichomonascus vanleenenianus]|uniref:uncharacterized protein n=1 Tax=Trichomonascus vanleenenianus TaxID=2268995 RepID=UPI003EC9CE59